MKKFGWYLMSVVPLLVMLAVQVTVAVVMMLGWMIGAGPEGGMELYTVPRFRIELSVPKEAELK